MIRYAFDLLENHLPGFVELDHVVRGQNLADALTKFCRKHYLEVPAYWEEPTSESFIDLNLKRNGGFVRYRISWRGVAYGPEG